jgi:hypothetical protein
MNKRLLSVFLSLCIILNIFPISVMAEETHISNGTNEEIAAFEPLTETEKSVIPGTSIQDLELPKTLTATVRTAVITGDESMTDSENRNEVIAVDDSVVATTSSAIMSEISESQDAGDATGLKWVETTQDISVTWTSVPGYDMDTEGVYTFTPVIESYIVSAALPQITVSVEQLTVEEIQPMMTTMLDEDSVSIGKVIITNTNVADIQSKFKNDSAIVTNEDGKIKIKLLKNIIGMIEIRTSNSSYILDANEKTITGGTYYNEPILIDNYIHGVTLELVGNGIYNSGKNNVLYISSGNTLIIKSATFYGHIYNSSATLQFMLEEGYSFFTVKNDNTNLFDEENTTTKIRSYSITGTGTGLVIVQHRNYGISLDTRGTYNFLSANEGYIQQNAKTVTITNIGKEATGNISIALSDDTNFALSTDSIGSITTGETATFTVQPKMGLAKGTYIDTITVSGENSIVPQIFHVSFTVDDAITYTISGTITDSDTFSGIPGAMVQLKSDSNNTVSTISTDSMGAYTITNVPPGTYSIEISADGYDSGTIDSVNVSSSNVIGKDLILTKTVVFIPVTDITMTNEVSVQVSNDLILTATTSPVDATYHEIIWSIEDANGTDATINGNTFRATTTGIATVKATVTNGLTTGSDFTKTFTITVTAAPTLTPDPIPISTPSNTDKTVGIVEKIQQQNNGAPAVQVNNSEDELKTSVLNSQEQEMVKRGENAKVILKITDINTTVSDEEKKLIYEKLDSENRTFENGASDLSILYIDLSLYKQVGSQGQTKVTETNGKVSISLELPKQFWNTEVTKSRTFYVIRIHDGEAIRIEGSYDPITHLFTFETDRFSTYALSYQDTSKIQIYQNFHHLRLTAKADKTTLTLFYKRITNADGYLIYGGKCGEEMKELAKVSPETTSYTFNNLKQGIYYKYQVKAYRIIDGEQVIIMISKVVHSITESKKYGNPTKVTTDLASVSLTVGESKIVTSQVVLPKGKKQKEHTTVIRYESSNEGIAIVKSNGKITAKAKGSCYIYAYAQNGVYKRIKVTVE